MSKLTKVKRKIAQRSNLPLKRTIFDDPKKRRRSRYTRKRTKQETIRLEKVRIVADQIKLFNDNTPFKKPRQWADNIQFKIDNLLGGKAEVYAIATTPRIAVFGITTDRQKFEAWVRPIIDEINLAGSQPVATYGWYEAEKNTAWVEGEPVQYIILIASLNVFKLGLPRHLSRGHVLFFLKKDGFERADPNSLSDPEVLEMFQGQILKQMTKQMERRQMIESQKKEEKSFDPFDPNASW